MTDAEINAQTAWLVGHHVHGFRAGVVIIDICVGDEPTGQRDAWDPINDGADFDEVLMWARKRGFAVRTVIVNAYYFDPKHDADTEFRRAVCLAIVEASK